LLYWYRGVWFVVDATDVAVGELADAVEDRCRRGARRREKFLGLLGAGDAGVADGDCAPAGQPGDRLLYLFGDPSVLERPAGMQMPVSDPVIDLIERGQAEGAFDPEVSARWIQHTL
jgi:hypothetical protein